MSAADVALHVAQISFFVDPARRAPEVLLRAWPSLVDVAECAAQAGVRVSVLQASEIEGVIERNGVSYHFCPFGRSASRPDQNAGLAALLQRLVPQVHHVHGLGFPHDVVALAHLAPQVPILLQDHANHPPRLWRRPLWRRGLAAAQGVAFCARTQAEPFRRAHLISAALRIYEIPESTSRFTPGDQGEARRVTQIGGDPALLWVGHLVANKDPLTVLAGFSAAARELPDPQLWCYFGTAPLLDAVRAKIAADPVLRARVHLMGRAPHADIEQAMRAADLFVSGSHREGSGYSLLEALACGLPPLVTDIPSFRALTGDGRVGALWPCGDAHALARALVTTWQGSRQLARNAARAHFERELSFRAVGCKLRSSYQDLLRPAQRASLQT
jgi:glycosyltransferase involved in cell wall biosynthesis